MTSIDIFDESKMRANKRRAASRFGEHDFLLRHAAAEIAERVAAVNRPFRLVAGTGAWNGAMTEQLLLSLPGATAVSIEASPDLLRLCSGLRVQAREDALPLREGAFDLVVSSLSLHLVNDLPGALLQIRRALKPDGLFLGALLGGETLTELREALMLAEMETAGGVSPRVFPAADLRDLGGLLQRAGFALPVADSERLTVTYPDALALMRDLRAMGGANMLSARTRRPTSRATVAQAAALYAAKFPAQGGRVRATFEIIYLSGWSPHESQRKPLRPGSARARLADALGTVEHPAGDKAAFPAQPAGDPLSKKP